MIKLSTSLSLLLIFVALTGCDNRVATEKEETITPLAASTVSKNKEQHANLSLFLDAAEIAFKQLSESGSSLQLAIEQFIHAPTSNNLTQAKKVLLDTHHRYMLAQVFQKIDILHPEFDLLQSQPTVIHPLDIRLDQHPIIPGYLDAVPDFPASGLIFSEQALSAEFLNSEHQFSDKAYVAIGFHALELLLTGGLNQTTNERSLEFGNLSKAPEDEHLPNFRRSHYVQLLAELINNDLKKLSTAWTKREGFYPTTLNKLLPEESDRLIQQAYKIEEHALSQIKEHNKDNHLSAIEERKAQLALILKNQNQQNN